MIQALLDWLTMGGYFLYVWSAYAMVFAVLLWMASGLKGQRMRTRKKLRQWWLGQKS